MPHADMKERNLKCFEYELKGAKDDSDLPCITPSVNIAIFMKWSQSLSKRKAVPGRAHQRVALSTASVLSMSHGTVHACET